MKPIYNLHNIKKRHGTQLVLDIDQLDLEAGQSYALLGPNGAGKSTLLELLALLSPPCEGTLQFAGGPVEWTRRTLRTQRERVTLVHQTPYLFNRNVFENLAFGLTLRGICGGEQARIIGTALEKVGLAGFGRRHARRLSGGEAQRVALARALALRPEVLLLDEPTANVDRKVVPMLEQVIDDLRASGTTLIVATHDHEQATRLHCQPLRLENGRLSDPAQHLRQPSQPSLTGPSRTACVHCCAA